MKPLKIYMIIGSFLVSLIFFGLQKEWIIIQKPTIFASPANQTKQKECLLYWNANTAIQESKTILWTEDTQQNMHHLLNAWLTFLHEEELHKKLHIDTTLLNRSKWELFISFDRKPFNKQQSIQCKLNFIQSLLKTIAQCTTIKKVRFLLHHQSLNDPHIDFSQSWNIL